MVPATTTPLTTVPLVSVDQDTTPTLRDSPENALPAITSSILTESTQPSHTTGHGTPTDLFAESVKLKINENKPAKPTTQNAPAVNTHHAKIKIRGGSRRAVSQQNVVAAVTRKSMNAAWALCHRSIHTTRVINDERTERRRNSAGQPVGAGLIPMINQLQAIFAMIGTELDLPQIVVIGSQSAGKSSVLENLVGRDFLPRGSGVVTRRPLILQLTRTTDGQEYAEFLHKPNTKYTNFDMVRLEIEAETDRRAGKNKGLSAEPILLKIFSPNVLNLTLVDTPGITRIPMGDQPPDIEDQIRNMIRGFISKNNAIILAVTAANQDLSTSDALKLAKEADPEGARTIGVLTKLDLMDRGTDAVPILMGRHLPLTHGWIGLVNRSQLDINSQKTIARSLQDEMDYFGNHPAYKLLNDRTGTGVLGERCSRLLTDHIRKTLPKLRAQISELIKQRRAELEAYGEPTVTDSPAAKGWQVLQLLNKFSQDFRAAIDGVPADIETKELNGGARIRYIFNESFMSRLAEINATTGLSTSDIRTAIRNAAGPKPALFVPEKAFEQLVKRQIELLREPALSVVEQVHGELLRILSNLETKEMLRFRRLREKILEVSTGSLKKSLKETNRMVDTLIKLELSWINTNHPDFVGVNVLSQVGNNRSGGGSDDGPRVTARPSQARRDEEEHHDSGFFSSILFGSNKTKSTSSTPAARLETRPSNSGNRWSEPPATIRIDDTNITDREKVQIDLIKSVLDSYFKIVKKNLQDSVVKCTMMFLVNSIKDNLQKELVASLYRDDLYDQLLYEAEDVAVKRRVCQEELESLQKAKKIIQSTEFDLI